MTRQAVTLVMLVLLWAAGGAAQDTSPIVSEAIVEAPLDAVWAAWTTSDGLRSWLAPHAAIDLRLGGLMRTNYNVRGALDDPQTIENRVLSYDPGRMLSIKVAKAPDSFPFPNAIQEMWTVIYLEEAGTGRTRVRVVGLGFGAGDESQKMRAFFERGNALTLEGLQRHFSGVPR